MVRTDIIVSMLWMQRRLDTITCTTFFAELAQKLTNEFYVNF